MKLTFAPFSLRAHPSGTSREYPPACESYTTKACESGMSPTGFTSGATALSVEVTGSCEDEVAVVGAFATPAGWEGAEDAGSRPLQENDKAIKKNGIA
jgi:hypothetical protein